LVDREAEDGVGCKFESDRNVVEWLKGVDKLKAIDSLLLLLCAYARSGDKPSWNSTDAVL
jgi:hypothetical protein